VTDDNHRPPSAQEIRDLVDDLRVTRRELSATLQTAMKLADRITELIVRLLNARS
jgi:hypothetical protein